MLNNKNKVSVVKALQPEIVVDLFGGSGLLSHLAKRANPCSRVIYNDYDNYCERLAHIEQTNELLRDFRELLCDVPADTKIAEPLKTKILKKLSAENAKGYVDWISMSVALKFSMKYAKNYADFEKNNPMPKSVRDCCTKAHEYLFLLTKSAKYTPQCSNPQNTLDTKKRPTTAVQNT